MKLAAYQIDTNVAYILVCFRKKELKIKHSEYLKHFVFVEFPIHVLISDANRVKTFNRRIDYFFLYLKL